MPKSLTVRSWSLTPKCLTPFLLSLSLCMTICFICGYYISSSAVIEIATEPQFLDESRNKPNNIQQIEPTNEYPALIGIGSVHTASTTVMRALCKTFHEFACTAHELGVYGKKIGYFYFLFFFNSLLLNI